MSRFTNVLWDLDGTLTDPQEGIIKSIQFALESVGRPAPRHEELLWCIGPPLHETFARLVPGGDVPLLVEKYRERYAPKGIFENSVFWGIPAVLTKVRDSRHFVCTSKPHYFARQIVDHYKIAHHFVKVYGSELDGRLSEKRELMALLLKEEGLDPSRTVMIGDRMHDVESARANGVTAVGITWGYGSRSELAEAGADHIFESTVELGEFLT